MKNNLINSAIILAAMLLMNGLLLAQDEVKPATTGHGIHFVDLNNDGFNDNAPDADKDGIPNGRDNDYTGKGKGNKGFKDLNGDGINDNAIDSDGDGIPNGKDPDFVRPQDGSGSKKMYGKNNGGQGKGSGIGPRDGSGPGTGTGTCDGTGPKGKGRGGRR